MEATTETTTENQHTEGKTWQEIILHQQNVLDLRYRRFVARYGNNAGKLIDEVEVRTKELAIRDYVFRETAVTQLATKAGVGVTRLRALEKSAYKWHLQGDERAAQGQRDLAQRELLEGLVKSLAERPLKLQVTYVQGDRGFVSGVVTEEHVAIRHSELKHIVLEEAGKRGIPVKDVRFTRAPRCGIYDFTFGEEAEVGPGDAVRMGMRMVNGNTGSKSVKVQHWVERLVCSNGAVALVRESMMRRRHVGEEQDILEQFRECVVSFLEVRFTVVDTLKALKTVQLDERTLLVMARRIVQRKGLTGKCLHTVQGYITQGRWGGEHRSLYGLFNAFTAYVSHDNVSITERRAIEATEEEMQAWGLAGAIPQEWLTEQVAAKSSPAPEVV